MTAIKTLATGFVIAVTLAGCSYGRPAQTPAAARPGGSLEVKNLPHGDPPKIPWLNGHVLHIGSKTVTLPGTIDDVAVTKERIVTIEGPEVTARNLEGEEQITYGASTDHLVMNEERNIVAWMESDSHGVPRIFQDGHAKALSLPEYGQYGTGRAVAVTGHDCFNGPETVEGAGCSVFFYASNSPPATLVSSNHGLVDSTGEDAIDVRSDGALLIPTYGETDEPVCATVKGTKSTRFCGPSPLGFSPDGSKVLGDPDPPMDGPVLSGIAMNDATTGKLLAKWTGPVWDYAWEDDTHVLVLMLASGDRPSNFSWQVERIGLDGTKEIAVPPTRPGAKSSSQSSTSSVRFSTQP